MDYSKMSDAQINEAVFDVIKPVEWRLSGYDYCKNPADAWPIITESNISLILDNPSAAMATCNCVGWYSDEEPPIHASNQNPLRAAMIVFLMMQDSANVPTYSTR